MEAALKSWELDNNVTLIDPTRDALFNHDRAAEKELTDARPWSKDPNHFKHVRISAVALIKMVMHARSGGALEIMGCMHGYVTGDTFIITDAFRLPVEGTETRVNAQSDANEYLIEYTETSRAQGRTENVVGWYHSHPGYGCWLSGIDVETQKMQQQFTDPFLAIVIDPDRTINVGKVEIGAFRTYPDDYKSAPAPGKSSGAAGQQDVPLAKLQEFGAHSSRYYSLEVSHFKSTLDSHLLDLLWQKYWVQTLSANPMLTNRDYGNKQILDLGAKISQVTRGLAPGHFAMARGANMKGLTEVARDGNMITTREKTSLMAGEVKTKVFNGSGEKDAS
ncbi:probable COP9 signalosome complex subunit 5 [Cephalotrichum gorgonifer]|uniref:COP9 signalosome complex subunit 5 n=1 Tax=Cephalotrichum gorgonifer TaxID=2041049 RepID=A0AAE8MYM7_9PEZI|nr:probable COP9 signalosome complex subunit 5 [Cephalotrichum gorgonifer]